jgi:tetratricopeptide (TPR) repeat protein
VRRDSRARRALVASLGLALATSAIVFVSACSGWSPLDPFEHNAPAVDEAITDYDGGNYRSAEELLEHYLKTGACGDGGLGLPEDVTLKPNGSFDLGLTLFRLAEKFGHRFGDEDNEEQAPTGKPSARAADVGCAAVVVQAIAQDAKVPFDLRARAYFLAGNLRFMQKEYKDAVRFYDAALTIIPGLPADAGADSIGRDAAHNRAIALRRLEDEEDARQDASDQADQDAGGGDGGDAGEAGSGEQDASDDGGGKNDGSADGGDDDDGEDPASQGPDAGDAGRDAGGDASSDAGNDNKDQGSNDANKGDAGADLQPKPAEPQKGSQQDDRMLDRLEEAPSYQQQEARMRANRRRHTMEDK